jgi:cell division protein FtsW
VISPLRWPAGMPRLGMRGVPRRRRVRAASASAGWSLALAGLAWRTLAPRVAHAAAITVPRWSVTGVALALLCLLQLLCLWRTPAVWAPSTIAVAIQPGQSLVLGQQELAAPQADRNHVALRRDMAGRWWIRNVSAGHQLLLQRGSAESHMGSAALAAGQQLRIGAALFSISAADATSVAFTQGAQQWHYDGATLRLNGAAQPACADTHLGARAIGLWNRVLPRALTIARPLTFGGNLYCGNRLGIANVAAASAVLARGDEGLLLSGAGGDERAPLLLTEHGQTAVLAQIEQPLAGVTGIVAGRTRLGIHLAGDRLELHPTRHIALFTDAQLRLPEHVSWEWRERGLWTLPAGAAWLVALGLCAALAGAAALAWQRGRWPFMRAVSRDERIAAGASALLLIAGIGALLLQRAGTPPGIGVSVLLGCTALWCCLLAPGRLPLASAAALLLLAVGLLAQLELGLGALESSWPRHFQKSTALLAIGMGAGVHLRLRWRAGSSVIAQTRLEWMLAAWAVVALAGLLLQVVLGDEQGVFDLQPVEFAKLALTALTAHCIAVGMGWNGGEDNRAERARRWIRLAAPALLFLALLGLALVQVDDYSPLILLLVWSMVMAFAWSVAARRHRASATLLGIGILAALAIGWLRATGVDGIAQWGFYADRFLVWLDPAQHPHTGQQMLEGARAIAQGAWWGTDDRLGLSTLGQPGGLAVRIPAVQDDFAPAFFLNRHGLVGALALWALQALFLVGLLATAARAFAASERARDFRAAWLARLRCFALCVGAAFVLGHFLLSWGTNLAIFPIMGQPMSFLSAGGSHLLFFICPLLAFSAISAQSLEE